MTLLPRFVRPGAWLLALAATACGGQAQKGSGDDDGAKRGCEYDGRTFPSGASFPATDGCNRCSCEDGDVSCTLVDCLDGCAHGSAFYAVGQSFPASDGCNTCVCEASGRVSCSESDCSSCMDIAADFSAALEDARACDPARRDSCSQRVTSGLVCGCDAFVDPANISALERLEAARSRYSDGSCGENVLCGPCWETTSASCSPEGRCETQFIESGTVACRVNGVVYESGRTGVPDPFSCNTCDCENGELVNCTQRDCPSACPPNAVMGTQCAQCGPTDGCEVVEHACLVVCSDECSEGLCLDGVCKNVCG